jgi:hypothetical protein
MGLCLDATQSRPYPIIQVQLLMHLDTPRVTLSPCHLVPSISVQLSEIVGVLLMQPLTRMKSKIYLLTLLVSVGLIAADEPASSASSNPPAKGDAAPGAKPGKKKDKGPKAS